MAAAPQEVPQHAGQVVRRVLLRRNIAVDAETAQLVAAELAGWRFWPSWLASDVPSMSG